MRIDLVEVHPRRILVGAVLAVLAVAVASRPPARPAPPTCAIEHELDPLNDQRAARQELSRLERQLDEVANALEADGPGSSDPVDLPSSRSPVIEAREGQVRDGRLIRN